MCGKRGLCTPDGRDAAFSGGQKSGAQSAARCLDLDDALGPDLKRQVVESLPESVIINWLTPSGRISMVFR